MKAVILFLPAALLALSACMTDNAPADLASARETWRAHAPARFSYTFRTVCFCSPESVRVVATRDSVLEARNYDGNAVADAYSPQSYSIDSVFADLEALAGAKHYKLRITFDPEYGFPDTVDYDRSKEGADDEFYQVISDFHPEGPP
jgi:hypothetical protein